MKYFHSILVIVSLFACQNEDETTPKDEIIVLGNIVISNQEELEQFAEEVQEIHYGNLEIRSPGPVDLSLLKKLRKIEGNLIISKTEHVTDLDGFSNLESIGGSKFLTISYNQSLENIDGLNNLSGNIFDFDIHWNPKLNHINYLGTTDQAYSISILGNKSLKSIEGFNSFEKVNSITIGNTSSLTEVTNVFNSLDTINESFSIGHNPELTHVQGFDELTALRDCDFLSNKSLSSIDIFGRTSIELSFLRIVGNESLESLQGFENINKVSILWIAENKNLENLEGLENINKVSTLQISENSKLYDFCGIRNIALGTDNFKRLFITNNGNSPTIEEIIDLECSND